MRIINIPLLTPVTKEHLEKFRVAFMRIIHIPLLTPVTKEHSYKFHEAFMRIIHIPLLTPVIKEHSDKFHVAFMRSIHISLLTPVTKEHSDKFHVAFIECVFFTTTEVIHIVEGFGHSPLYVKKDKFKALVVDPAAMKCCGTMLAQKTVMTYKYSSM